MSFGRVSGLHRWRKGWRADVLRLRDGEHFDEQPPTPPVDEAAPWRLRTNGDDDDELEAHVAAAWAWWRSLGAPATVLAPMIGGSGRAFRVLCRESGVGLCYSQMYEAVRVNAGEHAELFTHEETDRPLVVQLAGDDVEAMVAAAKRVEGYCDAVDVNLGCPQSCAEREPPASKSEKLETRPRYSTEPTRSSVLLCSLGVGEGYGAALLERDATRCCDLVRALKSALAIPVTVKIRLQPPSCASKGDDEEGAVVAATVAVCLRLERAGASLVAVHARRRDARDHEGPASWLAIREVKAALRIPVVANGSIRCVADFECCLKYTRADACMSATALLRRPDLFFALAVCDDDDDDDRTRARTPHPLPHHEDSASNVETALRLCRRYLALASAHREPSSVVRDHFLAMLQGFLMDRHVDLWSLLGAKSVTTQAQFNAVLDLAEARLLGRPVGHLFSLRQIKRDQCARSPPGHNLELGPAAAALNRTAPE